MKRFWTTLATFSIVETIGRHPVMAGVLMLLGVGGGVGVANLITPTILPQPAAYFNQNQAIGYVGNSLKPNGGTAGAMELPASITHSFALYFELGVDPALGYGSSVMESPFLGMVLSGNNSPGLPAFAFQRNYAGQTGTQWFLTTGPQNVYSGSVIPAAGTNYNTGFYPFTATNGNCAREPSGVWWGGTPTLQITDPGFDCAVSVTIDPATIPGDGAQQATGLAASLAATTCVSNSPVSGEMTVTAKVAVAHGITPGMTYTMQGFSGTGFTGYNATYIALPGTSGTTLVGETTTGGGTCPTSSLDTSTHEGTALGGTGASLLFTPGLYAINPYTAGQTGITTHNGQHICAIVGEYGDDSPFPGTQFVHMVDDKGNALPGAPAFSTWLNQNTSNFTGYTQAVTQDASFTFTASFAAGVMTVTGTPGGTLAIGQTLTGNFLPNSGVTITSLIGGSGGAGTYGVSTTATISSGTQTAHTYTPALTITALNPYTITGATYSSATGYVTFTTSTSPGFVPGSEFTVSGMNSTGVSVNQTYVAVNPSGSGLTTTTYQTSTTIYGNPISGPGGMLQPFGSSPGTISTGVRPQLVSNIVPGMMVLGGNGAFIEPYRSYGATGTGGVGTYAVITNQTGFSFTGSISGTTLTLGSTPSPRLVVGQSLTSSTGAGFSATKVVALLTGSGASGSTYQVDVSQTTASGTITAAGTIGSSGTPVNIYAYTAFYYNSASPSTAPSGGNVGLNTRSAIGDFVTTFGTGATNARTGWGGTIGNVAMLYGVMPQATAGAPSTASLASLCKKTTDINSFATANGMTVNSLYRLNDLGVFGDSSYATVQGYITNSSGTNATLNIVGSPVFGSLTAAGSVTAKLTGPGLPVIGPVTISLTSSSSSTYALSTNTIAAEGSAASPLTFSLGQWVPMLPVTNTFTGYIDNGGGSMPTLHVTALPTSSGSATFTGSLVSSFTGGTGGVSSLTLTVTAPTSATAVPVMGVGTVIQTAIGTPLATVTGQLTSTAASGVLGLAGTYSLNTSVTISNGTTIYGTGALPSGPTSLVTSGATGTIATGMYVTDGGASLTGQPLLITGGSGSAWTVAGNYYPAIVSDAAMVGSTSSVVLGTYLQNSAITNPVKVIGYGTGNGGLGSYVLSGVPNSGSSPYVGTSGSPVTITGTSISDGGVIAAGTALTIRDQGPGVVFPVTPNTISCSAFGSCTATGTLFLSGTYDTNAIGGAPSTIQAQISLSAGGPPVPGCPACTWTNLSSYSARLSSGTVFKWSGRAVSIPANGAPLFVSVRAANGTAYATLPNSVKVGLPFDGYGQGQFDGFFYSTTGLNWSYFTGDWGVTFRHTAFGSGNEGYLLGPPVTGALTVTSAVSTAGDRFGVTGSGIPLSEGVGTFEQLLTNAFGWSASVTANTHDGTGDELMTLGNVTQTQTIGVGNGSSTTWCSASAFCTDPSGGIQQPLTFSDAAQTGAQFTGTISGSTLTVGSTMTTGALMPGMVLTYSGSTETTTLQNCTANCGSTTAIAGANSVWALSNSPGTQTNISMRADYPQRGGTPWPTYNKQLGGSLPIGIGGYGSYNVKPGTFKVSVNGTVICQDTQTFAYNNTGGNCTDSSSNVLGFVNYQTGDYQITFLSAPANNYPSSPHGLISYRRRSRHLNIIGCRTLIILATERTRAGIFRPYRIRRLVVSLVILIAVARLRKVISSRT